MSLHTGYIRVVHADRTIAEIDGQLVDLVAIERAINGTYDGHLLTRVEREEAARVMARHGCTAGRIRTRLRMAAATVLHWQRAVERERIASAGLGVAA
jgi:hypothetical protein